MPSVTPWRTTDPILGHPEKELNFQKFTPKACQAFSFKNKIKCAE
jgi:hypothetical protein